MNKHWLLVKNNILTQPMANLYCKLFGVTYLVGKIKFKLLFNGPLVVCGSCSYRDYKIRS